MVTVPCYCTQKIKIFFLRLWHFYTINLLCRVAVETLYQEKSGSKLQLIFVSVATNQLTVLSSWEKMLPESRISILMVALVRILNSSSNDISCKCRFVSHLLGDILFSQVSPNYIKH